MKEKVLNAAEAKKVDEMADLINNPPKKVKFRKKLMGISYRAWLFLAIMIIVPMAWAESQEPGSGKGFLMFFSFYASPIWLVALIMYTVREIKESKYKKYLEAVKIVKGE